MKNKVLLIHINSKICNYNITDSFENDIEYTKDTLKQAIHEHFGIGEYHIYDIDDFGKMLNHGDISINHMWTLFINLID